MDLFHPKFDQKMPQQSQKRIRWFPDTPKSPKTMPMTRKSLQKTGKSSQKVWIDISVLGKEPIWYSYRNNIRRPLIIASTMMASSQEGFPQEARDYNPRSRGGKSQIHSKTQEAPEAGVREEISSSFPMKPNPRAQ